MLTENEMIKIAEEYVKEVSTESSIEMILVRTETIKKKYGMIFFYTSKEWYNDPDNFSLAIAGNAPFLVEKDEGKIIEFGTARSEEYYIGEYEAGRLK